MQEMLTKSIFFSLTILMALKNVSLKECNKRYKKMPVPLDHSHKLETFNITYAAYNEYFVPDGSILLHLSDDVSQECSKYEGSLLQQIAAEAKALVIIAETRFSPHSLPENYSNPEVFKHLTIEHIVEDTVHLISTLKKNFNSASQGKVILFGCEYNGNLAVYTRIRYPLVVYGVVASNAPLDVKPEFREYFNYLAINILMNDIRCFRVIKEGFRELLTISRTENSTYTTNIESCKIPYLSEDVSAYALDLSLSIENILNHNNGCKVLRRMKGSYFNKICKYYQHQYKECYPRNTIKGLANVFRYYTTNNLRRDSMKIYLKCTEFCQFHVSDSVSSFYGISIPLTFYTKNLCPKVFGKDVFDQKLLDGIQLTKTRYHGKSPQISRALYLYGFNSLTQHIGIKDNYRFDGTRVMEVDDEVACMSPAREYNDTLLAKAHKYTIAKTVLGWLDEEL